MQVDQATAILLGKIALSGLWSGYSALSEQIFKALILLRPEQSGPWLGLSMCFAHTGQYSKGAVFLEEQVLSRFPNDPHVLAWHGFLLCMSTHGTRGRSIMERLLQDADIPEDVRGMAQETINTLK